MGYARVRKFVAAGCLAAAMTQAGFAGFPAFRAKDIDPHCGNVCYAVTVADVNGDGKSDIVAVTENRVLWYQNPTWQRRVIIEDQTERDNVCIAAHDIDGDGRIDFALGAGWTKIGTIQWLSRGKTPDEKWNVHFIGRERWLHRMRFADVLGKGKPQLVISPLNATTGTGVRLTAFEIPDKPRTGRWKRTLLDDGLNRMHNHWHTHFDRDGLIDTVTASQEGIYLVQRNKVGEFHKRKIGTGAPGGNPNSRGAGEVKVGKLKSGGRFIATVEPMHGSSAVVYTGPQKGSRYWTRHVLDTTLKRGHAVWLADVDGDGSDELIVGHSNTSGGEGKSRGVYVYDAQDTAGTRWKKHVIDDGGIAVEDAVAADLTGDGKIDIVAGGRYTHNIKLYINQGNK